MKIIQVSSVIFLLAILSNCFGEIEYQEFSDRLFLSGFLTADKAEVFNNSSIIETFTTLEQAEQYCSDFMLCRGITECVTQNSTITFIPREKLGIKHERDQGNESDKLRCPLINKEFIKFQNGYSCLYQQSYFEMFECPQAKCKLYNNLEVAKEDCSKNLHCGGVGVKGEQFQLRLGFYRFRSEVENKNNRTVSWLFFQATQQKEENIVALDYDFIEMDEYF